MRRFNLNLSQDVKTVYDGNFIAMLLPHLMGRRMNAIPCCASRNNNHLPRCSGANKNFSTRQFLGNFKSFPQIMIFCGQIICVQLHFNLKTLSAAACRQRWWRGRLGWGKRQRSPIVGFVRCNKKFWLRTALMDLKSTKWESVLE